MDKKPEFWGAIAIAYLVAIGILFYWLVSNPHSISNFIQKAINQ